jgi:hypothetical protein
MTTKHALLRMIELHNATDTLYPAFSITSHPSQPWLVIEGSQGEIFCALAAALMNASAMSAADRTAIKRAMYTAHMVDFDAYRGAMYFPDVAFPQREEPARACGTCDRCLFGERCEVNNY